VALTLLQADKAFPTIVRYIGLITTLVLIGFTLAGYYVQAAPGFVAAAGMLLYKTVKQAAEDEGDERRASDIKEEKRKSDDLSDW
jgi:hypothetical protein